MNYTRVIVSAICLWSATAQGGDFRSGAAQVSITPPMGVPMSGYYYERAATGVHDELYAHARALKKKAARSPW